MGRPPMTREMQVSKKLSWLLRHHIIDEGLTMDAAGYVNVKDVLSNRHIKSLKVTLEELQNIVASNDKQRFSLIPASDATSADATAASTELSTKPQDYLIRANQGHSVAVDAERLLTPIDDANAPTTCVHGTTHSAWLQIAASGGLKPMTRQQIHFASGLPKGFKSIVDEPIDGAASAPAPAPVISGMRNSSTVLVYVDVKLALAQGIKFWLSENGVILSEGNSDGIVPLSCFSLVEDRTGEVGILVKDGQVVKDAPAEWATKGAGRRGGKPGAQGRAQSTSFPTGRSKQVQYAAGDQTSVGQHADLKHAARYHHHETPEAEEC